MPLIGFFVLFECVAITDTLIEGFYLDFVMTFIVGDSNIYLLFLKEIYGCSKSLFQVLFSK